MPATIMLWLTSILIFSGWLTYLFQIAFTNAQRQVLAGVPQEKLEGVHLFPVFPVLPSMVCLCLWSFHPPLSLAWLVAISLTHSAIVVTGIPECLRIWKWLRQQDTPSQDERS